MPADLDSVAVRAVARAHPSDWVWIAVLALTAAFQFARGAPVDGGVFAAAAVLLVLDTVGILPALAPTRLPARGVLLLFALACAVVLIVAPLAGAVTGGCLVLIGSICAPFVWPGSASASASVRARAEAPVAVPGAGVGVVPSDARTEHRVLRRTGVLWAVLAVLVCLWELVAFYLGASSSAAELAHPTISSLVEPFVAWPWGKPIFVVLWLLGGIALLRIGHRTKAGR